VRGRKSVLEWLFWQMGGLGPMSGQAGHFLNYAPEKIPYAQERYKKEVNRLYGVLERQLARNAFIAGADYSIADMASYPWVLAWERLQQDITDFPAIARWIEAIEARPATLRAYKLGEQYSSRREMTDEEKKILFGQTAASTAQAASKANASPR